MNGRPPPPGMKILVVEDSRTQAEYLRHILENEQYRVVLAANGREALELIPVEHPAIILTDIVMPEINGYDLCRRIKADPGTSHLPVIVVTQLFDPLDIINALEAGADDFIVKPIEPAFVVSRIRHVMDMAAVPDPDGTHGSIEMVFPDGPHSITASRLRILSVLLSTYDLAVKKASELQDAREHLAAVNAELGKTVERLDRSNRELVAENTERRRVEDELARANRKLQLMASITRHDLINQLTALHELVELAQATVVKEPGKAGNHIQRAGEIVRQTINTVKFTEEYQKIGMKTAVWQDLRSAVGESARQVPAAVTFRNEVPPGLEVLADPLLGRAVANLVDRAVAPGSGVTVVRFTAGISGDALSIVCGDDGPAIPADEKEKIFTFEHGMNTGFGLYIAREILAVSGLRIRETGADAGGARFEISCPAGTFRNTGMPGAA